MAGRTKQMQYHFGDADTDRLTAQAVTCAWCGCTFYRPEREIPRFTREAFDCPCCDTNNIRVDDDA
jgi:hypothetical protein